MRLPHHEPRPHPGPQGSGAHEPLSHAGLQKSFEPLGSPPSCLGRRGAKKPVTTGGGVISIIFGRGPRFGGARVTVKKLIGKHFVGGSPCITASPATAPAAGPYTRKEIAHSHCELMRGDPDKDNRPKHAVQDRPSRGVASATQRHHCPFNRLDAFNSALGKCPTSLTQHPFHCVEDERRARGDTIVGTFSKGVNHTGSCGNTVANEAEAVKACKQNGLVSKTARAVR